MRASEKYTNTDMVYLAKGGATLFSGQFLAAIISFAISILFANLLDATTYGTYKFILSAVSIFVLTSLSGMTVVAIQSTAKGHPEIIPRLLFKKIYFGLFGSIISFGFALYYFLQDNILLSIGFLISSIFIPFYESYNIYNAYLIGKKKFKESVTYENITRLFYFISIGATLLFTDSLFALLLAYFIPWTTFRLFFYYKTIRFKKTETYSDAKLESQGFHLSILNGIGTLANYLDKILLFHFLGAAAVAVYSFALIPVEQAIAGIKNLITLSFPKFSERTFSEINRQFTYRTITLFVVGIILTIVYVLCAPALFTLFFPQYVNAILFSQLLSLLILVRPPLVFLTSLLQSKVDVTPKHFIYARSSSSLLLIVCLFIFTPLYGIIGAIISRIISIFMAYIILFIEWKQLSKKQTN